MKRAEQASADYKWELDNIRSELEQLPRAEPEEFSTSALAPAEPTRQEPPAPEQVVTEDEVEMRTDEEPASEVQPDEPAPGSLEWVRQRALREEAKDKSIVMRNPNIVKRPPKKPTGF